MPNPPPLGLIAGQGIFPQLVAIGARAAGRPVICAGFAGSADPELIPLCDVFQPVSVVRPSSWIRFLRRHGVTEAVMVGRVAKDRMYKRFRVLRSIPDLRAIKIWMRLKKDKRPYTVLTTLANELASEGIHLIDSTKYAAEHLAHEGVMTRRQPTERQWADIRHAWNIAQSLSRMDVGQALAVVDLDVIAVEAIEGTNAMIERAGSLCKVGNWTCVKVSNTTADMRLDVPTIGLTTIEKLAQANAACLVVEAGKVMLLEKPKVLAAADQARIAIVGILPGNLP